MTEGFLAGGRSNTIPGCAANGDNTIAWHATNAEGDAVPDYVASVVE